MSRDLLDLVRELNTLNDDNLADRVIENSDVQWCLSELQDILEEMPTLTPPNEWVSVDNKLPKNGVPVLIGNPHWDYPVVANYAGHGVWMDSWKQKMTFTPTHWMLLPAPPAKEDQK